ncbi:hypothetical protein THAOC_20883 [Thalassiosira oceanica]|uniref:Cobalamin adenosyltransferase-like domain-containing protein n=1 Tax=Thalassiosira oceanica TaxID=159749 RepID=K0S0V0_THAOC|nr:hypothetical protein THAOC_20883 [Thalassiosira oceanica]|eukprot:EJK58955.1 hypothetical protein THAOC_20883 [Thalassiosira oceanica]
MNWRLKPSASSGDIVSGIDAMSATQDRLSQLWLFFVCVSQHSQQQEARASAAGPSALIGAQSKSTGSQGSRQKLSLRHTHPHKQISSLGKQPEKQGGVGHHPPSLHNSQFPPMLPVLIYPSYSALLSIARKVSAKTLTAAVTTIDDCASGSVCSAMKSGEIVDVEDLHRNAILEKRKSYTDPPTGFTVFTELAHLKRGVCCGNMCRHCPYGWANVRGAEGTGVNGPSPAQVRAVRSGDVVQTGRLVRRIMDGTYYDDEDSLDVETSESNSSREQQLPTAAKGSGGRAGGTLTSKNVPYTRSGDMGVSQLFTGERRSKDDILFEAMGTVDELCSTVGVVYALIIETSGEGDVNFGELPLQLLDVMSRLFDVGSHIARPTLSTLPSGKSKKERFNAQHVDILEQWIDNMTEQLP